MDTDKVYAELEKKLPQLHSAGIVFECWPNLFRAAVVAAYYQGKVDSDLERITRMGEAGLEARKTN